MPSTVRGVARRLRLGALGGAFGGGAIAFTLMACYGAAPPPCPDGTRDCLRKTDDTPSATSSTAPNTNVPSEGSATPSGGDAGK